ncbi:MAG: pyridoxamine 5'-phosphate oxidase family protein [Acidimicrobiia bacterium]
MEAADVYLAKPAPEVIAEHLERPIKATIGTLNPDGSIHLAFVIFLWEDGRLYFETASMTKKARNVAERQTASFAFDGAGFMAMAEGVGRIISGDDAHAINGRLRAKYLTPAAAGTVGASWGTVDDVAIEITPTKWRSWSSEVLTDMGKAAAGDLPTSEWWVEE